MLFEALRMLCSWPGRDLCTGRGRGKRTSSRDASELGTSASPTDRAAVAAASGRTALGPAGGSVATLEFELLLMSCARAGRDLCARREGGEGTGSRDASELCIVISAASTGGAAVEAASGRRSSTSVGPADGNAAT